MSSSKVAFPPSITRRALLGAGAAAAAGVAVGAPFAFAAPGKTSKQGATGPDPARDALIARPPEGFAPMNAPGKIVRVTGSNTLQPNGLWPVQSKASNLLERAMIELTGATNVGAAFARFVHPADKVAIKMNGLAGRDGGTMATNKETVLAVVQGVIAAGVPAASIVVYEQWESFMEGTRVASKSLSLDGEFPAGVVPIVHQNKDATMDPIQVYSKNTRFVRVFTEATAVINVGLIKDHNICGYTGCLKNITHGSIVNPHDYHDHLATPQIAEIYGQDICRSRVRLHITDGFKLIYDQGPKDVNVKRRVPHESIYATTDPVAMDVIGWQIIDKMRTDNALPTLKDAGREPAYIQIAGDLGLGIADRNMIRMREVQV